MKSKAREQIVREKSLRDSGRAAFGGPEKPELRIENVHPRELPQMGSSNVLMFRTGADTKPGRVGNTLLFASDNPVRTTPQLRVSTK